jgi:hypothetical protein
MTRPRFEVVATGSHPSIAPEPQPSRAGAVATGVALLALLTAGSWLANRKLGDFLSALDDQALAQASSTLQLVLQGQREQLVSEVSVLADDNRIRSTVLAPSFDEATVKDVLDDLRKSSGASLLAVLDQYGKVKVVSGVPSLKEVSLGSSSSVKAAFSKPTSDIWTLPDQVQVVGLAPIRSGDQTPAILVKGLPLGRVQLAAVEGALGVAGGVLIADRVAVTGSDRADLAGAFRTAGRVAEGTVRIGDGDDSMLARIVRTGDAATAARVAWMIPDHYQGDRARVLTLLIWCPIPFGLLMLLLVFSSRRTNGGSS